MKKPLAFFVVVLLVTSFVVIPLYDVFASSPWLDGWSYRQQVTLSGATGAGTDYPMFFDVYRGSGTSVGTKLYLNNQNLSPFPNDLNVTDDDAVTPLPYYIESYNTSWAGVWVSVADSLESGTVPIFFYWGKAGVTSSSSDGDATFLFFDDFPGSSLNTTKWDELNSPTISVADSIVTITSSSDAYRSIMSDNSFGPNVVFKANISCTNAGVSLHETVGFSNINGVGTGTGNKLVMMQHSTSTTQTLCKTIVDGNVYSSYYDYYPSWKINEIYWKSGLAAFFDSGDNVKNHTSYVPTTAIPVYGLVWASTAQLKIDWVFVRKWVEPSPEIVSWQSAENSEEQVVSNNTSDVDGVSDIGTHSNFVHEQDCANGQYDTLTEGPIYSVAGDNNVDAETVNHGDTGTTDYTDAQDVDSVTEDMTEDSSIEDLWVNDFSWTTSDWSESGSDPYLHNHGNPNLNYIQTNTDLAREEYFEFADSGVGAGTINSVTLYTYAKDDTSDRADEYEPDIWDGTAWTELVDQIDPGLGYAWYQTDVSSILDTWAKINAARVRFDYDRVGSPSTGIISIAYCYLKVDYTEPSVQLDIEHTVTSISVGSDAYAVTVYAYSSTGETYYLQMYNFSSSQYVNFTAITASTLTWHNISFDPSDFIDGTNQAKIRYWQGIDATIGTLYVDYAGVSMWEVSTYRLNLEIQWTDVNYTRVYEELCIKTGSTGSEDIKVYVRYSSSWNLVFSDLSPNTWNNISVSSYLDSSTFTVRFLGGIEDDDTTQDTWQIDCALLHTYEEAGNHAPTNDLCESTTAFDVDVYGWSNMTVSDQDGVTDLKTVDIQITTSDAKTFTLRWTQATNTFSEESDPDSICTLDVSGSVRTNIDADTDRLAFKFKISVAAQYGVCSVQATTVDDSEAQDQDTYPSEFSINFYASITVNDATHAWTGLSPGDTDVLVNGGGGSDGDIDLTVTTNGAFDVQAKGSGDLTYSSYTIPLSNVKAHKDTLGSAVSLSTSYQDVPGLTNQAQGIDIAKSFKLWLTVPDPKEDGDYVYQLYVQIVAT